MPLKLFLHIAAHPTMTMKTYNELIKLKTYSERLKYLQTSNRVGEKTFGEERHLNQMLYGSTLWKSRRQKAIIRDNCCDLGLKGLEIDASTCKVVVHHIVPITEEDIVNRSKKVYDLDNLITVSEDTHKKIHYGSTVIEDYVPRRPNDTVPWRMK